MWTWADPLIFSNRDPAEIVREHLFTPSRRNLLKGIERPPLKTIRLNRAPVLLPDSVGCRAGGRGVGAGW